MRNIENKRDILSIELKAGIFPAGIYHGYKRIEEPARRKSSIPLGGDDRLVHLCGSE